MEINTDALERVAQHACFGGRPEVCKHRSSALSGEMRFGVFLLVAALRGTLFPTLYWSFGLTCTDQNFITNSCLQAHAARHAFIVVAPDTSQKDREAH